MFVHTHRHIYVYIYIHMCKIICIYICRCSHFYYADSLTCRVMHLLVPLQVSRFRDILIYVYVCCYMCSCMRTIKEHAPEAKNASAALSVQARGSAWTSSACRRVNSNSGSLRASCSGSLVLVLSILFCVSLSSSVYSSS